MTDKTHQLIGLTSATAVILYTKPDPITWPVAIAVLIGSVWGSIFPDIDHPTSNFWDHVPLGRFFGTITSRALGGHRNLSHSLLGLFLFYWLTRWLLTLAPNAWSLDTQTTLQAATIGFVAHLAADAFTAMGIPLLWPLGQNMGFPPHPFHGARIITGKWFENLVIFPLVSLVLLTLIWLHLPRFCPILPGLCS